MLWEQMPGGSRGEFTTGERPTQVDLLFILVENLPIQVAFRYAPSTNLGPDFVVADFLR